MMEFFLSASLPLIDFVVCDVMSDMANKPLSGKFAIKLSLQIPPRLKRVAKLPCETRML